MFSCREQEGPALCLMQGILLSMYCVKVYVGEGVEHKSRLNRHSTWALAESRVLILFFCSRWYKYGHKVFCVPILSIVNLSARTIIMWPSVDGEWASWTCCDTWRGQ